MDLTLVVMAAGMGSRFGGLKQITPVDNDGNFLIDYSIYDAIKAGFTKVVFIIKKENLEIFKETIGKRLEKKIKVEYALQDLNDVPEKIQIPSKRVKPWGTIHAILAARNNINSPFVVINADDFYGKSSYKIVADFLKNKEKENASVSIPYPFSSVDSKHGFVKRGVLSLKEDCVTKIIECNVGYEEDKVIAKPLNGNPPFEIAKDHPVSMNMFGFQENIVKDMEEYFKQFLFNPNNDLETAECLLPDFLEDSLAKNKIILKYRTSNAVWLGMTFKEDLEEVKNKLQELKNKKEYPNHLWEG